MRHRKSLFLILMKRRMRRGRGKEGRRARPVYWTTAVPLKGECDPQVWVCQSSVLVGVFIRYTVENAYLEEKEDGLNALAEIAENVG